MIVTAGVREISEPISQFYDCRRVLVFIPYYVTDLAGFMSEHQSVTFKRIIKHTVQNWKNCIQDFSDNDNVITNPLNRLLMNGQKSVLFTVSNTTVNSNREKMHSKLVHFQQLRGLHAPVCDTAESVNAVYSPMLLLSVARSFTSLTHILYYIIVSFIVQETSFFCKLKPNDSYFV